MIDGPEFGRKFIALTTGAVLLAGNVACGASKTERPTRTTIISCPTGGPHQLNEFNLIGGSKSGGINAVNTANCATMTDPSGTIIGILDEDLAFVFDCKQAAPEGAVPTVFGVTNGSRSGKVTIAKPRSEHLAKTDPELLALDDCA